MNRDEILAELRGIAEQLTSADADVAALTERSNALMAELEAMDAEAERVNAERTAQADAVRAAVENGEARALTAPIINNNEPTNTRSDNMAVSYRTAFAHYLQNRATPAEMVVLRDGETPSDPVAADATDDFGGWTTDAASAGPLVPTDIVNRIIDVAKQHAPLLGMVNLVQVPGGVKITVAGANADADAHAEGAIITPATDAFVQVTLGAFEVAKLIEISDSAKRMTVPAFENWLVANVGKAVGSFIEAAILGGSGEGEATGILTGITWATSGDGQNAVEVAAASTLTAGDVNTLISLLPGAFDANAVFVMSKKTLYQDFASLQDKGKHDLVRFEGRDAFVQGYPVVLDERVALHTAILGDFNGYAANMPETITIHNDYDITRNVYQYSGIAMFDGKPAVPAAFVKLCKASA